MSKIYLLYENSEWLTPLQDALTRHRVPYESISLVDGCIDIGADPPPGVFYCRMSASAHTRGHGNAVSFASAMLTWLERYGRRVINGSQALSLEISKVNQLMAFDKFGIPAPRSRAASGSDAIVAAAQAIRYPLIIKPNCGGKGLGVVRVNSAKELKGYIESDEFDSGPDGIVIVQQYIQPQEDHIVRNEFVGGKYLYSVKVVTGGEFELCPADACAIDAIPRFEILGDFRPKYLDHYLKLLSGNGIEIAGVEFLTDANNKVYTYDVNVNTNYNTLAEKHAGYADTVASGVMAVAEFLRTELHRSYPSLNKAS